MSAPTWPTDRRQWHRFLTPFLCAAGRAVRFA